MNRSSTLASCVVAFALLPCISVAQTVVTGPTADLPMQAKEGPPAPAAPDIAVAPQPNAPQAIMPLASDGRAIAQVAGGSFLIVLGSASVVLAGVTWYFAGLAHGLHCVHYDSESGESCEELDTSGLNILGAFLAIGGEATIITGFGRVIRGAVHRHRARDAAAATPNSRVALPLGDHAIVPVR